MSGYSEVLYVTFAMIIISTMALNANRLIKVNNVSMIEGHLESQIIAYAQDIIEESRALSFDEKTTYDENGNSLVPVYIPDGFSTLGPEFGETSRSSFNDFDDFDAYRDTVSIAGVEYTVNVDVTYVETTDYVTYTPTADKSTLKQITVNMQSVFLKKNPTAENTNYNFSFIRSYYAD